jgi:hypothetical protein
MPVDPWGYELTPDQGGWVADYGSGPSWWDLASQGIDAAREAYIYGELGYPPGSTNIYAPQYPQPQTAQQMPQFTLQPTAPLPQPVQQGGFQISTTMALVLGVVGFAFLFGKRGR